MKSQTKRVLERLEKYGEVTNFWAIKNYILRLGAIIFILKGEGYKIERKFGTKKGDTKNSHYYLVK